MPAMAMWNRAASWLLPNIGTRSFRSTPAICAIFVKGMTRTFLYSLRKSMGLTGVSDIL